MASKTPEQLTAAKIAVMKYERSCKEYKDERIEHGVFEGGIKLAIAKRLAPEQARQEHELVLERASIVSKMTPTAKRKLSDAMAVLAGLKATPEPKDDESTTKATRKAKAPKAPKSEVLDAALTANDSGSK